MRRPMGRTFRARHGIGGCGCLLLLLALPLPILLLPVILFLL